jgi:hypothetical protein
MQNIAFSVADLTVPTYIEWVVANAQKFEGVQLAVSGQTDDELAACLDELIRPGLAHRG